jgi:nitric oxide reductase NorD protein
VTVWLAEPALASVADAAALRRRNAPLVAGVRRRFERCRPRRMRRGRQTDGPDLDLDAVVSSFADRRAGGPIDDRLYEVCRPLRRELAISLLVDVSASTDAWVSERRRIVDVERDALLVVAEALDALGDRYALVAFSGEGPGGVTVSHLKGYGERYGPVVQRRIAALEPQHFTRLGAAIRHATAGLVREAVGHRLLLVLSDGKPNDVDLYDGRYGVEDAAKAVVEARLQHIHPFCLTVDRQAPAYMPRIFGPVGFATLRRAEGLTSVLVDVISGMIRA